MSFTESVKTCFNKCITFKGRATRSEHWWFTLCATLVTILLPTLFFTLFGVSAMLFARCIGSRVLSPHMECDGAPYARYQPFGLVDALPRLFCYPSFYEGKR